MNHVGLASRPTPGRHNRWYIVLYVTMTLNWTYVCEWGLPRADLRSVSIGCYVTIRWQSSLVWARADLRSESIGWYVTIRWHSRLWCGRGQISGQCRLAAMSLSDDTVISGVSFCTPTDPPAAIVSAQRILFSSPSKNDCFIKPRLCRQL